jgi:transcriptional regulator with XRE-family HTH domain
MFLFELFVNLTADLKVRSEIYHDNPPPEFADRKGRTKKRQNSKANNQLGDRMGKRLRSEDMRKIMGKKIRILREMNSVKQVELAKKLGYKSTGTISLIENGIKGMKNVVVIKAAEFFRIDPSVLFSSSDMDKDELEIYSAVMRLMDERRRHPKRMSPHVEIFRRILLETVKEYTKI